MTQTILRPVGIGLRHAHYADIFTKKPTLDCVEVHTENFFAQGGAIVQVLHQAAQLYPISLHGVGLSLGSACGLDDWHLQQIKRLVDTFNPVLISDHLCFGRALIPKQEQGMHAFVHANDLLPIRHTHAALQILTNNINRTQDTLKRRIAVENVVRYIQSSDHDYSETDFINALSQRTGCGILLDINNVYVNTFNTTHDRNDADAIQDACRNYIQAIQPDSVMELHLAGCTPCTSGLMIDDHAMPVSPAVWHLYRDTLQHLSPTTTVTTVIEWDTALPPLDDLLAQAIQAQDIISNIHTKNNIQKNIQNNTAINASVYES
jgi:uncharacterized protein